MPNRTIPMSRTILGVACASLFMTTAALAQGTFDKTTIYTFSAPVELPGVALQAGQYIFRLADPSTTRKILQVVSADNKHVYGNFFWAPLDRPEIKSEPEVRLMEAAAGSPPAIRAVWYPGERTGWELIYPREQAMRIARGADAPVLTTRVESSKVDETATSDLTRVSASGQEAPVTESRSSASAARSGSAEPAPVGTSGRAEREEQAPASVVAENEPRSAPPSRAAATDPSQPARENLPKTASPQMTIGIASLCLLGAAGALRMWRRSREHGLVSKSE
jgi:hypothetical protein